MANALARSMTRVFTTAERLRVRKIYGDLISVHNAAIEELDAGNVRNAWALLSEALGMALRNAWLAMPGHSASTITERAVLLEKLRGCTRLDQWTYAVIKVALAKQPRKYSLQQCDLLAAIVRLFIFDQPAAVIVASVPGCRDPRQVEQGQSLPAALPMEQPAKEPADKFVSDEGQPQEAAESPFQTADSFQDQQENFAEDAVTSTAIQGKARRLSRITVERIEELIRAGELSTAAICADASVSIATVHEIKYGRHYHQQNDAEQRRRAAHSTKESIAARGHYLPSPDEIEAACDQMREERYPAELPNFPLRDDEFRSPHWRNHHRAMVALGLS